MPDADAATLLLAAGAACNDARLVRDQAGAWKVMSDPTEGALLAAAAKAGITREYVASHAPRVAEVPFDPVRKRMATVHVLPDDAAEHDADAPGLRGVFGAFGEVSGVAFVNGAPGAVLERCEVLLGESGI